jgi:hypothetical protein
MRIISQDKQARASDHALNGWLAGMAAGIVMMVFLILVGWMFGESMAEILGRFSLGGGAIRGALLHLGISGVYGLIFGLAVHFIGCLRDWLKSPMMGLLAGLIYGSFLWLLSGMILLSMDISPFATLPQPTFAVAHMIYGLTLVALVQRQSITPS